MAGTSSGKKPYTPPTLRSYGDLRKVTRGRNRSRQEVGGSTGKKTRAGTD